MKLAITLVMATSLTLAYLIPATATTTKTPKPCVRKSFKTQLIKDACSKGGQKAAKKTMKAFVKVAKKKNDKIENCSSCHSKLGGDFPLKENALELFKAAGGK